MNQATPAMIASPNWRGLVRRSRRRDAPAHRAASGCVETYSRASMRVSTPPISSSLSPDVASVTTMSHTNKSFGSLNSSRTTATASGRPCAWSIRTVVSSRYRIDFLRVRCPDPSFSLRIVTGLSEQTVGFFRGTSPRVRVLEVAGVLLEDHARVVAADLLCHDFGDVAAPRARAGDGIDQRECFFGKRDVRPDESHRVSPSVIVLHTP